MDRKVKLVNLKSALALMILSGVLVSACDILPSDTASQSSAELTQETTVLPETTTTTAPESSETLQTLRLLMIPERIPFLLTNQLKAATRMLATVLMAF